MRHLLLLVLLNNVYAFQVSPSVARSQIRPTRSASTADGENDGGAGDGDHPTNTKEKGGGDNKAMQFLKKIGKVGGSANRDFRFAIGVDEGPAGKSASGGQSTLKKAKAAFKSCVETGVVDDMSEVFPATSSGTRWSGFTDRVMGGISEANLAREEFCGRTANVLRGKVSMANNGGFIQMATNLAPDSGDMSSTTVDATSYEGLELDVQCFNKEADNDSESFNVHVKTTACPKPYSSYRASFDAPNGTWGTVRIPFANFRGKGPGAEDNPFDTAALTRVGIVAIGRAMKVQLALSGLRFYGAK